MGRRQAQGSPRRFRRGRGRFRRRVSRSRLHEQAAGALVRPPPGRCPPLCRGQKTAMRSIQKSRPTELDFLDFDSMPAAVESGDLVPSCSRHLMMRRTMVASASANSWRRREPMTLSVPIVAWGAAPSTAPAFSLASAATTSTGKPFPKASPRRCSFATPKRTKTATTTPAAASVTSMCSIPTATSRPKTSKRPCRRMTSTTGAGHRRRSLISTPSFECPQPTLPAGNRRPDENARPQPIRFAPPAAVRSRGTLALRARQDRLHAHPGSSRSSVHELPGGRRR